MNETYKVQNIVDGMIDFKRNASDTSRAVFETILKSGSLCVAFCVVLYNPDDQCPDEDRWDSGVFVPYGQSAMPGGFDMKVKLSFKYVSEQVMRIWTDRPVQPYQ